MHYIVELNHTRELTVELDESKRGHWSASVDDDEIDLKLLGRDDDGAFVVLVDGVERRFHLDQDTTSHYLTDDRDMVNVTVDPAGDIILDHGKSKRRGELDLGTLESPITGVALEVFVEEGDSVEEGQPVLIVEAMKMENTLNAPITGTVKSVSVQDGDRVFTEDELLRIDRD